MKKLIALFLAVILVGCCSLPVGALSDDSSFQIITNLGTSHYKVNVFATLGAALSATVTYRREIDLIRNASTENGQTVSDSVTLRTRYEGYTALDSAKRPPMTLTYTGTQAPLFTVAAGGMLTLDNINIVGNTNTTVKKGGLIYVQNGGSLYLKCSDVTLKNSVLNAEGSCGGAIYAEAGSVINILGVTYSGNYAATDNDIHCEMGAIRRYVDMNNDGFCDVRDLLRLKRHFADNLVPIFGTPDFNTDGLTNADDVLAYRSFLLTI